MSIRKHRCFVLRRRFSFFIICFVCYLIHIIVKTEKIVLYIKRSFVWLKKIVFDESFYEIVLLLIQFFSCTWLLLFLRAGRLCNVLSDLRLFFYSFDDFFFQWFDEIQSRFFSPVVFFVRFSLRGRFFFLLICKKKKGFCWMNWIVCRMSCRRICFFLISIFFWMGLKNFIVWNKFFYMCPFFHSS